MAERLGLSGTDKVVARVNHYFTDDEPLQIGTTYIPWAIARGSVLATEANTGTGSIYGRFADLGHHITRVREEISARMPRPDETETLAVPPGVPVIELLHTGIDQDGRPFEVTRFVMRADRSGLDYHIPHRRDRMKAAGWLRVAALAAIWGSGFLLIKISLRGFTPVQLTFARLALGAFVLTLVLVVMRLRLPDERRLWLYLLVAALLANAIPYTLFGVAEQTVASNLAGAINATTPLWTILFALLARRHHPLSGPWAGMILGFAGGLLILSPWQADAAPLSGLLACVGASASYGLSYVYVGRYLTGRGSPPLVLSAGS